MDRDYILSEIKRTAAENGNEPLGVQRFAKETGIEPHVWRGKIWARWGDAVVEAGFNPNEYIARTDDDVLIGALADEIKRLGRFPTHSERKLRRVQDSTFPGETTWRRIGGRTALAQAVVRFCEGKPELADVAKIAATVAADDESREQRAKTGMPSGAVYLIKSGKHCKIGMSVAFGQRERQLAIQLPEAAKTVHVIRTDVPRLAEQFWHDRFADKRVRPGAEFFVLDANDVATFKRCKFM